MREENLHAGGKWETMNFLGVALKLQAHMHADDGIPVYLLKETVNQLAPSSLQSFITPVQVTI